MQKWRQSENKTLKRKSKEKLIEWKNERQKKKLKRERKQIQPKKTGKRIVGPEWHDWSPKTVKEINGYAYPLW